MPHLSIFPLVHICLFSYVWTADPPQATRNTFEIAIDVQTLNLLLNQYYNPNLKGLTGPWDLSVAVNTLGHDLVRGDGCIEAVDTLIYIPV